MCGKAVPFRQGGYLILGYALNVSKNIKRLPAFYHCPQKMYFSPYNFSFRFHLILNRARRICPMPTRVYAADENSLRMPI